MDATAAFTPFFCTDSPIQYRAPNEARSGFPALKKFSEPAA